MSWSNNDPFHTNEEVQMEQALGLDLESTDDIEDENGKYSLNIDPLGRTTITA